MNQEMETMSSLNRTLRYHLNSDPRTRTQLSTDLLGHNARSGNDYPVFWLSVLKFEVDAYQQVYQLSA